jgi:hypothetical protein
MTKSNDKKKQPAKVRQQKSRNNSIPILRVKKGASLKAVYAAARRAFTAADLQKYTEIEEGIPAAQVLAELEAVDREETRKRRRKS